MEHNRCAVLSFDPKVAKQLGKVLVEAGYDRPQQSQDVSIASIRTYAPRIVMMDFDHLRSDKLESLRQLRFVLPNCAIAVVSSDLQHGWAKQCHLAGASAVLAGGSSIRRMVAGVRSADSTGCFTDPDFSEAVHAN